MNLLLDTQAFLYWTSNDPHLPRGARAGIGDELAAVLVSAASIWEITIKVAKGKLRTSFADPIAEAQRHDFDLLPILPVHALAAGRLPPHHDDPFDRMLIAQAQLDGLTIVTGDRAFGAYGVPVLWQ